MGRALGQKLRLILLDRDGVINEESSDFIKSPAEWQPLPGALAAIKHIQSQYMVGVATNQSGIARGLFTHETLSAIHATLNERLVSIGGTPVPIFFCPHGPADECGCRKPAPGLLFAAMNHFAVDASATLFIGDSSRDIEAAQQAGCGSGLVLTGNGQATKSRGQAGPDHIWSNLEQAARNLTDRHQDLDV